jgi:hypothetical protein
VNTEEEEDHTKFQPYSPSGYETWSANGQRTPRHGNSSHDPGELKSDTLQLDVNIGTQSMGQIHRVTYFILTFCNLCR